MKILISLSFLFLFLFFLLLYFPSIFSGFLDSNENIIKAMFGVLTLVLGVGFFISFSYGFVLLVQYFKKKDKKYLSESLRYLLLYSLLVLFADLIVVTIGRVIL
ncbi:MAG: hypothetical protein ACOZAR_03365 [Patescibacteria group bacterium]